MRTIEHAAHVHRDGAAEAAPERVNIKELRPGDAVDGLAACTRKAIVRAEQPDAFLVVILDDGQRQIEGVCFRGVQALAERFKRGDVVHVRGRAVSHRDQLQIRLEQITRHESSSTTAFLPSGVRDVDELDGFLEHLAREVHDPGYAALLGALLGDERLRDAWRRAACTTRGHHSYPAGMLEHTVAVGTMALELSGLHPHLNSDLLLTAALVHDIGHTRAFRYTADIQHNADGLLLGHVALGLELLRERAQLTRLPAESWRALAHCVLAHHGSGTISRRAFTLTEALALQRLVALDESVASSADVRRRGGGGME